MRRLTKREKDAFEIDPFFCLGRVMPEEYDWKHQFSELAKDVLRTGDMKVELDVGKVLGLVWAYSDLEYRYVNMRDELAHLKNRELERAVRLTGCEPPVTKSFEERVAAMEDELAKVRRENDEKIIS